MPNSERYVTDSLDEYPVGVCPNCKSSIAHADLTRDEDWPKWPGGDEEVPLSWQASGTLTCASCERSRKVMADVSTGSVKFVMASMREVRHG